MLVSVINAEAAKTSLWRRCCSSLAWTLCRVVTPLVTVKTGDMTQIFASRVGIRRVAIGSWGGIFPGLARNLSNAAVFSEGLDV